MAVNRGGVAFWVGCIRSHRKRQAFKKFSQVVDWQSVGQIRSLSSASWALVAPNSLRYHNIKQRALTHPFRYVSQMQTGGYCEEDWEESLDLCVVVQQDESDGLHTLLEIPLFGHNKLRDLLTSGSDKSSELSFLLTTVDGRREDDISVESFKRNSVGKREHGCFRSLFEAERCPAPFMQGSQFYCFHCPDTEQGPGSGLITRQDIGLDGRPVELPLLLHTSLCNRAQGDNSEHDDKGEEELAMMYERLRLELPSFLMKSHDYSMYSNDMEFINGLMNTKTRGRVIYRLTLFLGRFLCQCYYAKAQLEVLKLTKHMEDRTIKARWRIWGLPFHSLLLRFYRRDKSLLYRSYDAFSTFYIGQDGLIHCHKVEKVMPAQPPVLPGVTSLLAGALVALGVQEHRPALNLLPLLLSSLRQSRN